jgi:uncharacterized protein with HEPN domain
MLPERITSSLFDIRNSIDAIYEYLGPKRNFKAYMASRQLRRAVERELEIIGEAAKRIKKADPDFPLENARKAIDLRNWVSHGYDKISDDTIWVVVVKHLPRLRKGFPQRNIKRVNRRPPRHCEEPQATKQPTNELTQE